MSSVLKVEGLGKRYPSFELKDVSFSLEASRISGFIGRNGAGKTTTLKSLLNLVHPDSGRVEFFGKDFSGAEFEIKRRIGFVSGGVDYYPMKKISAIASVTKRFYDRWNEGTYRRLLEDFALDESKTPKELSAGMKVKLSLALALSHDAELLILDEPTSGLDPVSRDELLDLFMDLGRKGITIFFSTHITSDLDKCADDIVYIKEGRIRAAAPMKSFLASYKVAAFGPDGPPPALEPSLIGLKRTKEGYAALLPSAALASGAAPASGASLEDADLEAIMVHMDKERRS
jgi:ABC-2 type transport system ATP-binding protein